MSEPKKYYDPAMLPICTNRVMTDLCDQGEITNGELIAARFRKLSPWLRDPISSRFRGLQKFMAENPRPEQT